MALRWAPRSLAAPPLPLGSAAAGHEAIPVGGAERPVVAPRSGAMDTWRRGRYQLPPGPGRAPSGGTGGPLPAADAIAPEGDAGDPCLPGLPRVPVAVIVLLRDSATTPLSVLARASSAARELYAVIALTVNWPA